MWVAGPTARAVPHEIDSRSYWLEEAFDPDKNSFYFFQLPFLPEVSCHCGFDTSLSGAFGLMTLFLSVLPFPLPPFHVQHEL